jgi:hypothetical protein
MIKGVAIFAHSRDKLLDDCINSVLNAKGSENWKKILIYQKGFSEVEKIVEKYANQFDILIKLNKQFESSLANINYNRITGTFYCFNVMKCEYMLGIEEDTVISNDALRFIDKMFDRYGKKRAFRGINLGSHQPKSIQNQNTYSFLRFGLQGQGGVITRKTWHKLFTKNLFENMVNEGWDSKFEHYIKSGYMVTPNASRILDRGWGGTHAPANASSPYFERMSKSWVGNIELNPENYEKKNETHIWRKDAIIYSKKDSIFFYLRRNPIFASIYKTMRKFHLPRMFVNE